MGTGPYTFVELHRDDRMVVEAFDRSWRGAPTIRRIVFRPVPEPFTRAAGLRNGELDLITNVPPTLARELERVPGIRVRRIPSTWIIYLGLNAFKKPLSDVRVRQALNYKNETVGAFFEAGRSTMEPAKRRKIYGDLAKAMVGDATWVFLLQQVDIYAMRDRVERTPRPDQWMTIHGAALK